MDLGNGWGLSAPLMRKLRLLEYFADHSHGSSLIPPLPEWARQSGSKEHADAIADLDDFDSRGWLTNYDQDFGGGANASLSGPGYAFVEELRARRNDRQLRYDAPPDAILAWLFDNELDGNDRPTIEEFAASRFGSFYGQPFTDDEVVRAAARLEEDEYITGPTSWQMGIILPRLTAKGRQVVTERRSVIDARPVPTPSIVTITGSHNTVQAGSHGSSLHVVKTVTDDHRQQAVQLADTVAQAASALPAEVMAEVDRLRAAVVPGQDNPNIVKVALLRLQSMLIGGSTDLVGKAILGSFAGLLAHYGIPAV